MIGLVLAAGAGRRLRPYTDTLPKALVPVGDPSADGADGADGADAADGADPDTVLDHTLANFAAVGITDVAVVVGYRAEAVRERAARLERRYGVTLELVDNDHAEDRNNAYSLWCARDLLGRGALLANGDTLHPASVERTLLAARGPGRSIVLALDTEKPLAEEEMKVDLDADGGVLRINKALDPAAAAGEYIGVTLIEPDAAEALTDALQATYERDAQLYYEDGYQELIARGNRIDVAPIGSVEWVEIDNHDDLARARSIACRC